MPANGRQIEFDHLLLFGHVLGVAFADCDHLAQDFNIEAFAFGLREDFLDVVGDALLVLLQTLDAADEVSSNDRQSCRRCAWLEVCSLGCSSSVACNGVTVAVCMGCSSIMLRMDYSNALWGCSMTWGGLRFSPPSQRLCPQA